MAAGVVQAQQSHAQQTPIPRPEPSTTEPVEIPIGTEANTPIPEVSDFVPKRRIPDSITLKVGTWNLAARKPGEAKPAHDSSQRPKKNWRHTFGAERRTAQWRTLDSGAFDADIIALQGVRNVRTVRRLFHARRYHVVASRQLLPRTSSSGSGIAVLQDDPTATTAIVHRRRRGIRVTGFRHFLPQPDRQTREPVAITAVRLRIYGNILWIASADMPADCRADMSARDCARQTALADDFVAWAKSQVARQTARLILLGQWSDAITAQLANAEIERAGDLATSVACTPTPSAMRVFAGTAETAKSIALDNAETAENNACAATASLVLKLR